MKSAPLHRRAAAYALDVLVIAFAVAVVAVVAAGPDRLSADVADVPAWQTVMFFAGAWGFSLAFTVACCLRTTRRGQTIGKQLLGIRVVAADDTPVTARHLVIREGALKLGVLAAPVMTAGLLADLAEVATVVVIAAALRPSRRTLYDDVSRTRVVLA